jgi:hypothetical protein
MHFFQNYSGTAIDSYMMETKIHLKQNTVTKFLVAEGSKPNCIQKWLLKEYAEARGRTIKFANSPPCAHHGSTGQKP